MQCRIHFWRGWNEAVETVWHALAEMPEDAMTLDQRALQKALFDTLGRLFPDEELLTQRPTNAKLAAKYAISPRTVTNWRREGCPFEYGQWAVLDWVSGQRITPTGVKAKFARQLQRRRQRDQDREDCASLTSLANDARQLLSATKAAMGLGVL